MLLEAIPQETPLSQRSAPVGLNAIAGLIAALHRSGAPQPTRPVASLAERVEFVFGYWAERVARSEPFTQVVSLERLQRGHALAQELATQASDAVLLHGDLHPGNVLDGGAARGLVAIDPRPCVGDAAFDVVDWVFWTAKDAASWQPRCRELAAAADVDTDRLLSWCSAFAAILAAGEVARGGPAERVEALLALAP